MTLTRPHWVRLETVKAPDERKVKYNLVCIGSTKDAKTLVVVKGKAQNEQTWSTTTLSSAPVELQRKLRQIALPQVRHKRMLTMSSKNFTFECQTQIKRKLTIFDDNICSDQDVSDMPNHQIRFDDGLFFLGSLIPMLFNHGSELDAHQLVNILLPFSKNPDVEIGRLCTFQPARAYLSTMLKSLQFIFAMSKRINGIMKDDDNSLGHMDVCQGQALFEVIRNYDVSTRKGRNELYNLIFDKKSGALGGIYEDMKHFQSLFLKENSIFENSIEQISRLYEKY